MVIRTLNSKKGDEKWKIIFNASYDSAGYPISHPLPFQLPITQDFHPIKRQLDRRDDP